MIVVDANVLIYAYNDADPRFDRARAWLERVLSGRERVGLSWIVIHAFIRITTSTPALSASLPTMEALSIVNEWLDSPVVTIPEPRTEYGRIFQELIRNSRVRGNLITDVHIAALAIENDAVVTTTDRDFARFPGVRVVNPLL